MFITSKNAITEAISKNMIETLYIKFPVSKREKDIIKLSQKKVELIIINFSQVKISLLK